MTLLRQARLDMSKRYHDRLTDLADLDIATEKHRLFMVHATQNQNSSVL